MISETEQAYILCDVLSDNNKQLRAELAAMRAERDALIRTAWLDGVSAARWVTHGRIAHGSPTWVARMVDGMPLRDASDWEVAADRYLAATTGARRAALAATEAA